MSLFGSLATARFFAGSFNFTMNHVLVFQSREPLRATVPRYVAGVLLHLGLAYLLVDKLMVEWGLVDAPSPEYPSDQKGGSANDTDRNPAA